MEEIYKGIEGLKSMFEEFKNRRNNELTDRSNLTESETTKKIGDIFYDECAKHLLCDGYFLIGNESDDNNKIKMYLTDIELYYHEEKEGGIKDYVMYHIPERYKNKKNQNGSKYKLKYFDLGTLNLHTSGIDVTFEKCENKVDIEDEDTFRASFLIRGYMLYKNEDTKPYKIEGKHPTHIYDDVFPSGFPVCKALNISWEPDNRFAKSNIKREPRYHVGAEYNDDLTKKVAEDLNKDDKTFTSGGKIYRQCQREWRFRIEPLPESKDTTKQN